MRQWLLAMSLIVVLAGCGTSNPATGKPAESEFEKEKPIQNSEKNPLKDPVDVEKSSEADLNLLKGAHPILDWNGRILGGFKDGEWTDRLSMAKELKGDEIYQVYSISQKLGSVTGSLPKEEEYIDGSKGFAVELSGEHDFNSYFVKAEWNMLPRKVDVIPEENLDTYKDSVKDLMISMNIPGEPIINAAYQCDIEGDGTLEDIIVSTNITQQDLDANGENMLEDIAGKYSMVSLRRPGNDGYESEALVVQKEYLALHFVRFIADIDGDGVFELGIDEENVSAVPVEGFSLSTVTLWDYKDKRWKQLSEVFFSPM